MTTNIEEYISEKGLQISRVLITNHNSESTEISELESEIFDVALCYAKIFFFETQSVLLDDTPEKRLRFLVQTRFNIKERSVAKMSNIDLVAHCIKLEVIEALERAGLNIE